MRKINSYFRVKELKLRLMEIHSDLVHDGNFEVAKRLLRFLRHGQATLGVNDADWEMEQILIRAGCVMEPHSRVAYMVVAYLKPAFVKGMY